MAYHTLCTREDDGNFYPQFGDYEKNAVQAELSDYRRAYRKADLMIIRTRSARQSEIEAALAVINTINEKAA